MAKSARFQQARFSQTATPETILRQTILWFVLLTLVTATPSFAADNGDFYESIYRRGVAHFNEGRFDAAQRELRIASFGFLESIPRFETANAYLVAAGRALKQDDEARLALQKILNAEKVTRTYASLPLPADVRTAVDEAANALLTREQRSAMHERAQTTDTMAVAPQPQSIAPHVDVPAAATTSTPPMKTTATSQPPTSAPQQPPVAPATTTTTATDAPRPTATTTAPADAPRPTPPTTTATNAPHPTATTTTTPTDPPRPTASTTTTPATTPSASQPRTETVVITEPLAPVDVASQLRAGDAALVRSDLVAARAAYAAALSASALSHADALRLAEGFYRARDFRNVVAAFARAGGLTRGEEPYRYYLAIAYYETGQYAAAKRELAAVLPFIEETPDVARYRSRIEAAIE